MQLELTDTQSLMREGIAGLLSRELSWERVRDTRDGGDDALWHSLAAAGWLSLPFADGYDVALLDASLLLTEVAKSGAVVPFLETIACAFVVAEHADGALDDLCHGVEDGTVTFAPAVAGAETATVAGGAVSGVKRFVDFGPACTHHVISAVEDGEPGLFVVDATGDAVTCVPTHHIGRLPQATATYQGAPARAIGGS